MVDVFNFGRNRNLRRGNAHWARGEAIAQEISRPHLKLLHCGHIRHGNRVRQRRRRALEKRSWNCEWTVISLPAPILQKELLVLVKIFYPVILDDMRLGVIFCASAVLTIRKGANPRLLIGMKANVANKVGHASALLFAIGAGKVSFVMFPQMLVQIFSLVPHQLAIWKRALKNNSLRRCRISSNGRASKARHFLHHHRVHWWKHLHHWHTHMPRKHHRWSAP